jgi:hypothetical protein
VLHKAEVQYPIRLKFRRLFTQKLKFHQIVGERRFAEIGDLIGLSLPGKNRFSYVPYNKSYETEMLRQLLLKHPHLAQLDAIQAIPALEELGRAYADECVKLEHLI